MEHPVETLTDAPAARDPAWGARVVLAGIAAVVAVLGITVIAFGDTAQDVIVITAPAFAVISGLVAAYFGVRAGSLAAERVQGAAAGEPPPRMSPKEQRKVIEKRGSQGSRRD